MYTLEVYSSIIWGGVIRCRELQSEVSYPNEVDDDLFSETGFESLSSPLSGQRQRRASVTPIVNPSSWLHGWNFTTELYRILEHAMDDFHRRPSHNLSPFTPSDLFNRDALPQSVILEKVMSMHAALPPQLKEARRVSTVASENMFSFQAANIAATLQVRLTVMVYR